MSEPVQAAGGDHTIKITVAFLTERITGRGLAQGGKLDGTLTKDDRQHTGASGRQSNARRCRPFGMKARIVAAVPTGSPAYGLPPSGRSARRGAPSAIAPAPAPMIGLPP
jgi:hypothetical protein